MTVRLKRNTKRLNKKYWKTQIKWHPTTITAEECLLQVDTTHDELVNYNEFIVWMVKLGVLESKGIKRTDLSAKDVQSAKKKGRRYIRTAIKEEKEEER